MTGYTRTVNSLAKPNTSKETKLLKNKGGSIIESPISLKQGDIHTMIPIPIKSDITIIEDVDLMDKPTHLIATISEKKYLWILKMMRFVKKNDIRSINDYDASPDYIKIDEDEDTEEPYTSGTECVMIHVCRDYIYWTGIIKHTDVRFESNRVTIKEIKKLIKFSEKPIEDMPLYLNDPEYELQYIAKERMKGSYTQNEE